ncbi:efflux transporter outer membrane subunit [Schlegelella sp. S2-27]|uniref:Efflux transporter outer membrane subunit n=1 Tax=Caldimonas mangrovi TaxID=2944811 RepID=A0ABT0YVC4_9BURK|nr:efflux transporter outer membrane subunit [Caldimonas mangrovi]MCM5681753.1 efflux transporter outer membrane subunit [Caldimonas mangrovi]
MGSSPLRLATLALALAMAGCSTMRTPYATPAADVPAAWSTPASSAATAAPPDRWWTAFGDTTLDTLVDTALARNNDLAAAALDVRRAQLQAGLTQQGQRPALSGSVSAQRQRQLDGSGATSRSHGASLGVSYEVDLWGRLASQTDAAQWEAAATEQDLQTATLSLAATVARLYWQLGYLNQRVASAEASVAYAERTQELVGQQYRAGAVSSLEVNEAAQAVAAQRAALSSLQQQRTETRHALTLLFDTAPGGAVPAQWLPQEPQAMPGFALPEVAAGLPAELLGRRPDLRAAEARLRSLLADADATRASYYPTLSLTGGLGSASTALVSLLSNPYAVLGAGITLPFLQVQQRKLDNELARTNYEQAVITFRQSLYTALGEVENALSARTELARQGERLAQALQAAREVERLYEVRYRNGAVPLKTWLDAQESRRNAEDALAENRLEQLNNQAALYLALGGSA